MAQMIPENGPHLATGSERAEPDIYWRLAKQLPDDFTVIHSIPWLSAAAKAIDNRAVPTGEIDFLVLHPVLGLLAIEVKGGVLGYDRNEFVYVRTGQRIDPVRQVRRGTHSLAQWIKEQGGPGLKIGYALLFPDSETTERALPPALIDPTVSPQQRIVLDRRDLPNLGDRIQSVMKYWRKALAAQALGEQRVKEIVKLIGPIADYTPSWRTRIQDDNRTWLRLTPEQTKCLDMLQKKTRAVVTGWPGTGKTLLAISLARQLASNGQTVLVLCYNVLLFKYLRDELADESKVAVLHFHGLCRHATATLGRTVTVDANLPSQDPPKEWYQVEGPNNLRDAIDKGVLGQYDALIVDEAQVFHEDWWKTLTLWMSGLRIVAFCDETQVFAYENFTQVEQIASILQSGPPFVLTLNLRSPRLVFERLQQVRECSYQQHCPRPQEEDVLLELAVESPILQLLDTIEQLLNEGVPRESIKIVYINQPPPLLADNDGKEIETVSVLRFRGLESPVIIVWAIGGAVGEYKDLLLFCAYSRATSRCIVIYDALEITREFCGTFGNLLLESEVGPEIWKAANAGLTVNIIKNRNLDLISAANKTGQISWCKNWAGWVVTLEHRDDVAANLWIDHLCLSTQDPIYFFDLEMRANLYRVRRPVDLLTARNSEYLSLRWCTNCKRIAIHHAIPLPANTQEIRGNDWGCDECSMNFPKHLEGSEQIQRVIDYDSALFSPKDVSFEEKRRMPISLIALGRWQTLTPDEQSLFKSAFGGGSIGYGAALVLTAVDVSKTSPGQEMRLDSLADRYLNWSLVLAEEISRSKWRKVVANALSNWKQRGWLVKKDVGIYVRTSQLRSEKKMRQEENATGSIISEFADF